MTKPQRIALYLVAGGIAVGIGIYFWSRRHLHATIDADGQATVDGNNLPPGNYSLARDDGTCFPGTHLDGTGYCLDD